MTSQRSFSCPDCRSGSFCTISLCRPVVRLNFALFAHHSKCESVAHFVPKYDLDQQLATIYFFIIIFFSFFLFSFCLRKNAKKVGLQRRTIHNQKVTFLSILEFFFFFLKKFALFGQKAEKETFGKIDQPPKNRKYI